MNYIVDDIGLVVAKIRDSDAADPLAPYYMYGHVTEINQRLLLKDKDMVEKYRKYPLVVLNMDIAEESRNGMWHYNLNIAILNYTDRKLNAEQRMAQVFKPILYPIYDDLMVNLKKVGKFSWKPYTLYPPHTKIDRPFWGNKQGGGNVENILSDPIDAIEIVNLKISQSITNC